MKKRIKEFQSEIVNCRKCPRLVKWRASVAKDKVARFSHEEYWGRPVPSFGDPNAEILIVGLAPAAHGANRTGRMFTGDRSGEWLYRAMHRVGYANQSESTHRNDGLKLKRAWITAIVRCAPPLNKPTRDERENCLPFLAKELALLPQVKLILTLGAFAWSNTLLSLSRLGESCAPKPKFGHGREAQVGKYVLLGSYHPSQQNTFTGRLTQEMLDSVFSRSLAFLSS